MQKRDMHRVHSNAVLSDYTLTKEEDPSKACKRLRERGESKKNMAVRIRLKRMGKKKMPSYRVVVADARSPRDGRVIEQIGWYNPLTEPSTININEEKVLRWLRNGAQPSEPVTILLKRTGIWERFEQEKAAARAARDAAKANTEQ